MLDSCSLRQIRKALRLPDLLDEIRSDFAARIDAFLKRPNHYAINGRVAMSIRVESRGFGTVTLAPDATLERRLENLQEQVNGLITATRELERRSDEDRTKRDAAIRELKASTEAGLMKLTDKLNRVTGGGMRLEIIGLLWVAVGVLLPSFSKLAFILWPR